MGEESGTEGACYAQGAGAGNCGLLYAFFETEKRNTNWNELEARGDFLDGFGGGDYRVDFEVD
jgi:hypothetical protein